MKQRVAIIDYGMGNLYSVRNSFAAVGIPADIVETSRKVFSYDKLVLPGVGAFGNAMEELTKRGFVPALRGFAAAGRPLLGICLGMQLLLDKSRESPGAVGLGIIPGIVKKFSSRLKCPHMGWNEIRVRGARKKIFSGLPKSVYAYFCHSYYAAPGDPRAVIGETDYGIRFACVIKKDNVVGMQFHPEKSQETGLKILKNFIELC